MFFYRLTVKVSNWSEEVNLIRSKPIEDRDTQDVLRATVQDLIRDEALPLAGSVDWELSEIKEVNSGTFTY